VTGHTKNEYKKQVKSRGTSKNFHLKFHLLSRSPGNMVPSYGGILTVKDEIDKQKASYNEKPSVHPIASQEA